MKKPAPRLALWLLERTLTGAEAEVLIGDLVERHAQKWSALWFWRQTIVALLHGAGRDLRTHPFVLIRAINIAVLFLWGSVHVFDLGGWMGETLFQTRSDQQGLLYLFSTIGTLLQLGFLGWVVGRLHASHPMVVIASLVFVLTVFSLPEGVRLLTSAMQHSRYGPYLLGWALKTTVIAVSWLTGGFAHLRGSRA